MSKSSKENRLFQNLMRTTEEFMQGKNFVSLTRTELMKKLHLPKEHREIFKEVLTALVSKGITRFAKGRYSPIRKNIEVVKGTLSLHPRGFGFVRPDDPTLYDKDIFIPKQMTQNGVDGDTVEVEINPLAFSSKGPEGKIITILKRGRTHLAGIVRSIEWHGDTIAYAPILGQDQRIIIQPSDQFSLHVGDRVVMEVVDWGTKDTETVCRVSHYLGHISDPSCDVPAAIEEYELHGDFPTEVLKEAKKFGTKVLKKDLVDREDLRDLECVTIDPDTAKDFDDALSISKDSKGNYHLGVHIADASHYVRPGSAIDAEAKIRSNSTYFPGNCLPMLPPVLSEKLCSLRPNVDRLAISLLMTFDKKGSLQDHKICRSVIKSKKRFTYKDAKKVLDGKKESPHKPSLKLMVELCKLFKQKRYERGSLEFLMPELAIIVDEKGTPTKTDYIPYDITHQLVEEFMLKANEMIALHLSKKGKDVTYRVHEAPSEDNMQDFVMLAHAFGFDLPEKPTPQDLQGLFDEALQTPFGSFLATSYIRRMRIALYSPENIGHYGLGLTHYCHFTSPIRRYVDLVVHRILFGDELEYEHLQQISQHCSEQERISERAENSVTLLKKLRLLDQMIQKKSYQQFEAVVTKVRNFGIYFEVTDFMLEGFFHLSQLDDDYYKFDEKKTLLRGAYTGTTYFAGDKIAVMVKNTDLITMQVEWNLVGGKPRKPRRKRSKRR